MTGVHVLLLETYDLRWSHGPINVIGLSICETQEENYHHNYEPKIKKIKSMLEIWRQRRLKFSKRKNNSIKPLGNIYSCIHIYNVVETSKELASKVQFIMQDIKKSGFSINNSQKNNYNSKLFHHYGDYLK